ncbi:zinc finger protein 407 [Podarcis raffonei]|uniref:zinc finger protein 407 n=1 Tax=Podarcis raffonei TaxID=65483 RepID=UPI00232906BF|nr:zinc finger protein 407 [Podarcis raffonei]
MDVEKNQKNDEGDENVQNELVQEAARNVLAEKAHSDSFSTSKIDTFSAEGQKNPGEKHEECATAKRPLSKSAIEDCIATNIVENEPVSKRLKLTVVQHAEENEGKLSNATRCEGSVDGTSNTRNETIKDEAISACQSSDALCVQHDFKSEDNSTQEIHVENEHTQVDQTPLPECTSSFQNDEASLSCATSSVENISKCKPHEEIFSTYPDLEKHIQESHLQHSEQQVNLHCTDKSECTPSLQTHSKPTAGQLRLYFCNLCGFQSFEKDLLQAHFLGKTHLRRQNLAARGGFVKILTKKPFHKKQQYLVKEKNVQAKSALNKPKIRNAGSNPLKTSSNKLKKFKTCHQLFVEMVSSKNISAETTENTTNEEVLFSSVGGNGDAHSEKLEEVSGPSKCNPDVSEPAEGSQETISSSNTTGILDRFPHNRNIFSRRITFKQSGSFRLNQQIKKRYNLLGLGKRNRPDSTLKHSIRTDFSQGDTSQVHLKVLETEENLCKADTGTLSLDPDGANACSSMTLELDNSPKKAVEAQKGPHPCTHCGCTLPNTVLELDVDRDKADELKFQCQTCGYSCGTKEDFELHHQKNNHCMGDCKINCPQCSFFALNEVSFGEHMRDEHGMSHWCVTCRLYFLNEEEVAVHNTTEEHISLSAQGNTVRPLSNATQQTASCILVETSVLPKVAEEMPKPLVIHPAKEFKESVLSRTQFQCKKCFYKTRSSSVLTRHIKLRHAQEYHFLCKACNLYSLSKEGMEKHIKRSKHLENARKNNIGLRFEECIERVCVGGSDGKKATEPSAYGSLKTVSENENVPLPFCTLENVSINKELFPSGEMLKCSELVLGSGQKRGRPKGTISRTCPHCGLLASSVTNLTVHIRRKHSHQYSYLCKVCNYYTVTKGDMERHCATKKHKGRLEANGKQNIEIIVCPEGGNVEASSKKINSSGGMNELVDHGSSPLDNAVLESQGNDQGNAIQVQGENVPQLSELGRDQNPSEIKQHIIEELGNVNQARDSLAQTRSLNTNDNKCAHCSFVAHSFSSLEVHIKRKHTKEFEYYCMACDYYAVTRREMIRHAATEKHKIKRQSYVCNTSGEETDVADTGKEQQPTDEIQIILDGTKYQNTVEEKCLDVQVTQKVKKALNYLVSEDGAPSEVPKEGYVADTVDVETNDGVDQGRGEGVSEEDVPKAVVEVHEVFTPKETVHCVLQENVEDQRTVTSNFNFTIETGSKNLAVSKDSPDMNLISNKMEEDSEGELQSIAVAAEEVKNEEIQLPIISETCCTLEQQTIDENTEGTMKTIHNLQEQKMTQQSSAIEEEGTLSAEQHEVEVSLNNIWGSEVSIVESVQESNEASDAFAGAEGRVKEEIAVQNGGQFDSSIVKLKSHEDGCEPIDHIADGQNLSGLRALKADVPQGGGKKKKAEGQPLGESTRIRCDDCGFLADGLSGLNVHIAMKHPSKEKHFHCLLCGKSFYTESNLHQHLASAGHMRNEQASVEELPEGGATFKCVKCTEPFDSEQNLFLHIKEQHEELLREVNKYIVEDTEQINREREENKGNICKYCGKMCRSSNSMAFLAHIRTHTGSKPFKCKICHFATAQLGDARNHVKRHLGMREYKCHVCGVAFVMKKHLNTHLLGKHGVGTPKERKFTCPLCDRSFTEKWALNNHMKLHTGEKPYKCSWPTCHYSFLTVSAMKDHYRTHTGEKSFLCDLCGFAGGTRHALTKHRRQHTGEKPFKCDECNFASTTQSHLTRHKRVHTGEKPYRCPWCDYRSNCAENIRKHILHTGKHEGVKMYNCPKCEYGTNIPVEFRNHLKELHPDIENPDLAYLHAGIVSKSYECRLKGQGATFVETTSPFTTAALDEISPIKDKSLHDGRRHLQSTEQVQQVIIIQGYDSDFAIDASVEETAAATLQTLAMAGQVARVVHITEDGQVITTSQNGSHVSTMIPGQILAEQLSDGKTQVVVVEGPLGGNDIEDAVSIGTASDPGSTMVQQIVRREILEPPDVTRVHPPESASALDALLCAVTELGKAENKAELLDRARFCHKEALQMSNPEADIVCNDTTAQETQMFHEAQETEEEQEPMEVVTQVVHPSTIIASQERAQVTFKKMVEGVLQFAVCDTAAADQLIKEGVTQVIVNEEGTVHMVAREGSQIIMQEAGSHALSVRSEHMNLVESDGEISQIIVTEEIAQAMVQDSNTNLSDGPTHYIVTRLPQEIEDESGGVYSHAVIKTDEQQEIVQTGTVINSNNVCDGNAEHLASMVIFTEDCSQTAIIQGQRDNNELQEA